MPDEGQADKSDAGAAGAPDSWVRGRLQDASPYLPPIIAALLVIGLFGVYYFVHVQVRRDYLVNRNFRALAILGDQIEGSIGNYIDVLWSFVVDGVDPRGALDHGRVKANVIAVQKKSDPREDEDLRQDYMHFLASDLTLSEAPKSDPKLQVPNLQVRRRSAGWELVMTADGAQKSYTGTVALEELFQPFVDSAPFDDVLLAAQDGSIIYQKAKTGPQFVNLRALLESQVEAPDQKPNDTKGAKQDADGSANLIQPNANEQWQKRPVHLTKVAIAGVPYQLFLQPVLISVLHGDDQPAAGNPGPSGQNERPQEWVLCGLIPSASLQWESLAISYEFMIWATIVFLAVLLGAPILKLLFLNGRERLRLRECATIGVCLILLTALTTFAALQATYFTFGDPDKSQADLAAITGRLANEIHEDLNRMYQQLTSFCQYSGLQNDLQNLQKGAPQIYRPGINRPEAPVGDVKYRYLSNAFWTDDDGHQLVKWSGSHWATPMIDLAQDDLFKNLKDENLPEHPFLNLEGLPQPFHFESTRAPNRVEYLAGLGMRTKDCVPAGQSDGIPDDIWNGRAFLTAKPFSLIDPVLPLGYGFALVDSSGKVLFHSDKTKNTRENFLEESDSNRELYSAILRGSTDRPLQFQYFGKDHLVLVQEVPGLTGGRLSLIVYRDLTHTRTLNLETVAIASTLFLLFLLPAALVAALLYIIRRPRYIGESFWPHKERAAAYAYQTGICILSSLLLALVCWNAKSQDRVIGCGVVLYGALFFIHWGFRLDCPECPGAGGRQRSRARTLAASVLTAAFACLAVGIAWNQATVRMAWLMPVYAICGVSLYKLLEAVLNGKRKTSPAWFPGWRELHTASVVSLLLLVGVIVPIALFRATLRVERGLQDSREQTYWREANTRRAALFQNLCDENDLPENCAPDPSTWSFPRSSRTDGAEADALSKRFLHLFYALHHNYNPTAAENLAMISNGPRIPAIPNYWQGEMAAGGLIVVLASLLVWSVGRKLFLLDVLPAEHSEKASVATAGADGDSGTIAQPAGGGDPSATEQKPAGGPPLEDDKNESLLLEALETKARYYEEFWSRSSDDERFVLAQLASDGVLNPVNITTIRSLLKGGLIVRKPQLQIMNESFRRFLVAKPRAGLRQKWQAQSRQSGWGKLSGVFTTVVILVAVFLLATQNALWESAAAYVTTALGGAGTMLKLLHLVRGDKAS